MRWTRRDGGAPRERHEQDATRIDAVGGEMDDAMGDRAGLARPRTRDHQERGVGRGVARAVLANTMLNGATLVGVELVEIGRGHRQIALLEAKHDEPCSIFIRNRCGRHGLSTATRLPWLALLSGPAVLTVSGM